MDTLLFSSICLLLATGFSYLGNLTALLDLISHFRVHYLLAGAVLLPFAAVHPSKIPLAMILLATIINSAEVLPWYIKPKSKQFKRAGIRLSVTSINVQFNNHGVQKVMDFVMEKNSDILLLSELNERWIKALKPLDNSYPHRFIEDPGNQFGIAIFSKFELENREVINVGEFVTPSLSADIKINGKIIKIIAIHPVPPLDTSLLRSRNAMFEKIANLADKNPHPTIIGGDFNVTMWAPAYKHLTRNSGLKNSRKGFGIKGTWPFGKANHKNFNNGDKRKGTDWIPASFIHRHPVKLPIDHILVSPEIMVENMSAGPNVGSDHLPITAELQV